MEQRQTTDDSGAAAAAEKPSQSVAGATDNEADIQAFLAAFRAMKDLEPEAKRRTYKWLGDKLGLTAERARTGEQARPRPVVPEVPADDPDEEEEDTAEPASTPNAATPGATMTAKQFLLGKKPKSLGERVTCLAYFLTHHRSQPRFKASDIAKLNLEAGQPPIGNPASAVDNARRDQLLGSAGSGTKQITVRGEALVAALPDREKVKVALKEHPRTRGAAKRKGKRARKAKPVT
jgi:hypothetical protein